MSMYKNVVVEYFRGIKSLQLEDMGQINLFLGKNNCGKSSVLDAIFLISGFSNPSLNFLINQMRDYVNLKTDDLSLNFYNLNPEMPIHLHATFKNQDEERDLKIFPLMSNEKEINITTSNPSNLSNLKEKKYSGLTFQYSLGKEQYITNLHLKDNIKPSQNDSEIILAGTIEETKLYTEKLRAGYMNSKVALFTSMNKLATIIDNKQEKEIVRILSTIEPKIQDIAIVDSIIKVDIGLNKLIPINMLGDGIRRLMAIVVAMYDCKDGIILIDEIDNGLHYTAIPNLWIAILEAAKTMNIQVLATTHNKDSLMALKEVLKGSRYIDMQNKTVSYTLRKMLNDELKAYKYNFEKFDFAINQDIEIR